MLGIFGAENGNILQPSHREFIMRKFIIALAVLSLSAHSFASTASANHGHHGGGNMGAVGAAAGAFGGSSSASSAASSSASAGSSGNGGSYWSPRDAAPEDAFQPWPESEMLSFQKP